MTHGDSSLPARIALVTGATSVVGLAVAEELARRDVQVFVHARTHARYESARHRIVARLPSARLRPFIADFTNLTQVREAAQGLLGTVSALDVLVADRKSVV